MLQTPFIPDTITVHLGNPDQYAENVTIDFPSYIKNVASSEIYPTWPENSLRANIYAIVSFALNRVYTQWYRSKGYDFDITSVTSYDQKFIQQRDIYDNISLLVDELFNDYVRKEGTIQPYFTSFCNGTTVTCSGLSQWGTVDLANEGYTPYEILQNYYGNDIEIVKDAEVRINAPSYPGYVINDSSAGTPVKTLQIELNRISTAYPLIPKIPSISGIYDASTNAAVAKFQEIFNLPQTGTVNEATWYKIAYIFTSVKRLSELDSEGIRISDLPSQYEGDLRIGMQNQNVRALQYYLATIAAYYVRVSPVSITGYYGEETENSVRSFQDVYGLPATGIVDEQTWSDIYRAYAGIVESVPFSDEDTVRLYPGTVLREGVTNDSVRVLQEYLSYISKTYPDIPSVNATGYFGPVTRSAVIAFQKRAGLAQNGVVGAATWNEIASLYSDLKFGAQKQPFQFPGYTIS
ncbi:MAG: peptidoglycan-binding protein [Oscillospiraceae bacterium]|nr:peptidoglycan-binding protein [Oscillospiraceae bacterium]